MEVLRGVVWVPVVDEVGKAESKRVIGLARLEVQRREGAVLRALDLKDSDERVARGEVTVRVDRRVEEDVPPVGLPAVLGLELTEAIDGCQWNRRGKRRRSKTGHPAASGRQAGGDHSAKPVAISGHLLEEDLVKLRVGVGGGDHD